MKRARLLSATLTTLVTVSALLTSTLVIAPAAQAADAAPTTVQVSITNQTGPLTAYGPGASIDLNVVGIDGTGAQVNTTGTVDLVDSTNTVVGHIDLTTLEVTHAVSFTGLGLGAYTVNTALTNDAGSVQGSQPLTVIQDTSTNVSLTAAGGQSVVQPYVDGVLDTISFHIAATPAHGITTQVGALDIWQGGQIVDTIPLNGTDATVVWGGTVGGKVAFGDYQLSAVYPGADGPVASPLMPITVVPTTTTATSLVVQSRTVYPYRDGYLDKVNISTGAVTNGNSSAAVSGRVTITRGTVVALDVPVTTLASTVSWDGRVNGAIVPGTYTVTFTAQGPEGLPSTLTTTIVVSPKKLVLQHAKVTVTGRGSEITCDGMGIYACRSNTATIGGKRLPVRSYTAGPTFQSDAVIALHSIRLPHAVRLKRWSLNVVGSTNSDGFVLFYCDNNKPATTNCSPVQKLSRTPGTAKSPWHTPWTSLGQNDGTADFLFAGVKKGTLSVASETLNVDFFALK